MSNIDTAKLAESISTLTQWYAKHTQDANKGPMNSAIKKFNHGIELVELEAQHKSAPTMGM